MTPTDQSIIRRAIEIIRNVADGNSVTVHEPEKLLNELRGLLPAPPVRRRYECIKRTRVFLDVGDVIEVACEVDPTHLRELPSEAPPPARWFPKIDERYFYFTSEGFVFEARWKGTSVERNFWKIANCFPTKEHAERAAAAIKEVLRNLH